MLTFERKVFLGALGFIIFIFSLVIGCLKQDFFLVADDYYNQEINYQQHIDKVKNANLLTEKLSFTLANSGDQAEFVFPYLESQDKPEGTITFFRPSDATQDVVVAVAVDETLKQRITTSALSKGFWKVCNLQMYHPQKNHHRQLESR